MKETNKEIEIPLDDPEKTLSFLRDLIMQQYDIGLHHEQLWSIRCTALFLLAFACCAVGAIAGSIFLVIKNPEITGTGNAVAKIAVAVVLVAGHLFLLANFEHCANALHNIDHLPKGRGRMLGEVIDATFGRQPMPIDDARRAAEWMSLILSFPMMCALGTIIIHHFPHGGVAVEAGLLTLVAVLEWLRASIIHHVERVHQIQERLDTLDLSSITVEKIKQSGLVYEDPLIGLELFVDRIRKDDRTDAAKKS